MTSVDASADPREAFLEAHALTAGNWLPPDSGWPALDALAAEHARLLGARRTNAEDRYARGREFEAEDRARHDEMTAAFREGREPKTIKTTPPGEREAEMRVFAERAKAAHAALTDFLRDAIEEIASAAPEWLGDLVERAAGAEEARREAARLLAEADRGEREVKLMREWVTRNGGLDPVEGRRTHWAWRFIGWEFLSETFAPQPDPPADERVTRPEPISSETLARLANQGVPVQPRPAPPHLRPLTPGAVLAAED